MKRIKPRVAEILRLETDANDSTLVKKVVVAVAFTQPLAPFAFRCPFCMQVHTPSNPQCDNPQQFLYVTDRHGKKRALHREWQFIAQAQGEKDRHLAGDLSDWLHSNGLEWAR